MHAAPLSRPSSRPLRSRPLSGVAALAAPVEFAGAMMLGAVSDPGQTELSGIAASRKSSAYCFAVGDSGSPNDLVPIRWNGKVLPAIEVVGATNTDWEDIASAHVATTGKDYLWIADTGNNAQGARTYRVYRVEEPDEADVLAGTADLTGKVVTIEVEFGAGGTTTTPDVEAVIADPETGTLYFLTKRLASVEVYKLYFAEFYLGTQTLTYCGTIAGIASDTTEGYSANAVGGCARPDGMEVLVKTYTRVYRNYRKPGETFEEMLLETHRAFVDDGAYVGHGSTNWLNEDKGESIDYRDADTFVTLSERDGHPFPQYLYAHIRQPVTEHSFQEGRGERQQGPHPPA